MSSSLRQPQIKLTDEQLGRLIGREVEAIYHLGGSRRHTGTLTAVERQYLLFWHTGWRLTFGDGSQIFVVPEDDVNALPAKWMR